MSSPKHKGTGCGLIDLPLRASHERRPVLVLSLRERPRLPSTARINDPSKPACFPSLGRAPMLVYVRSSNEALLRARVPGARTNVGVLPIPTLDGAGFE